MLVCGRVFLLMWRFVWWAKMDDNLEYIPDAIKRIEKQRFYCSWRMLEIYDKELKELNEMLSNGIYYLPRF